MLRRRFSDRYVFASLVAVHFLVSGGWKVFPDLVASYPFLSGDSHDWIANGLFLAGNDVVYTARPPLLPLVLAALAGLSLLDLYPVLAQLLVHGTAVGLFALLRLDYSRRVAGVVAAAWLLDTTWLKLTLPVMADVPAACLLFWALYSWRGGGLLRAGLFAGLAAVTQPLAFLVAFPVALTVWVTRQPEVESWRLGTAGLLFVLPTLAWVVVKKLFVGVVGDMSLRHWSLLRLHLDSVDFYASALVAFVGLPAVVGILLGGVALGRRALRRDAWSLLLLTTLGTILTFFVFLYDFEAARFLAHVYPLLAVLLAEGLQGLKGRAQGIACVVILVWAVLPSPGTAATPRWIALWPAPATYLVVDTEDGGGHRIETRALGETVQSHPYAKVWEAHGRPRHEHQLPDGVEADWALYFYDTRAEAEGNYRGSARLGNLLRTRVLYLPSSAFDAAWGLLDFEAAGTLDDRSVFRASIPSREGSWWVLVRTGGVVEGRIQQSRGRDRDRLDAELARAEGLVPHLAGRSVAVRAPASGLEPWQVYLPFVVPAARFRVIEPERESATRALLGEGRLVARVEDQVLTEYHVYDQPWLVIESANPKAGEPARAAGDAID